MRQKPTYGEQGLETVIRFIMFPFKSMDEKTYYFLTYIVQITCTFWFLHIYC